MLLKNLLSEAFIAEAAGHLEALLPKFDRAAFTAGVFDETWPQRELKERFRHVAQVAHRFMPDDFPRAAVLLKALAQRVRETQSEINFGYMFLPDYVEQYGLDHFGESVDALEEITKLMSAEFAVRPFLKRYPEEMMQQMHRWSTHTDARVRRLASEGSRPRLPWGMAVPFLKKDPAPVLPVLETLKADPEEFVRRSVANSLNDISKDHPDLALAVARRWKEQSDPVLDAVVKHACRTLLKKGHPGAIALFAYSDLEGVNIEGVTLEKKFLAVGEELPFQFELVNDSDEPKTVRLEYAVYFLRADGSHSRKVFKISEREYAPKSRTSIRRRQHFKPITTRRYYPGEHRLAVILNGEEREGAGFMLGEP